MKRLILFNSFLFVCILAMAQVPRVSSGKIIRWENMSSGDIMGRNVDIWLTCRLQ